MDTALPMRTPLEIAQKQYKYFIGKLQVSPATHGLVDDPKYQRTDVTFDVAVDCFLKHYPQHAAFKNDLLKAFPELTCFIFKHELWFELQ